MVTMPEPMSMLTDFCDWASRHPESAVNAFATHKPMIVVKEGLIDDERTMSGLLPVARMARPRRVLRKKPRKTHTSRTAMAETTSLYSPERAEPASRSFMSEKTLCVLFMLSTDEPPITAMFTE